MVGKDRTLVKNEIRSRDNKLITGDWLERLSRNELWQRKYFSVRASYDDIACLSVGNTEAILCAFFSCPSFPSFLSPLLSIFTVSFSYVTYGFSLFVHFPISLLHTVWREGCWFVDREWFGGQGQGGSLGRTRLQRWIVDQGRAINQSRGVLSQGGNCSAHYVQTVDHVSTQNTVPFGKNLVNNICFFFPTRKPWSGLLSIKVSVFSQCLEGVPGCQLVPLLGSYSRDLQWTRTEILGHQLRK